MDTEVDVPTWLAVLVLDDDDVAAYPGLALEPVTVVLGDLFPAAVYGPSTLGDNYSYFTGAKDTKGLEAGQRTDDPMQVIDVPLKLFADIAPTLEDLKLTAHVRQLSVQNKPAVLGAQLPADPIGTFSILVGNGGGPGGGGTGGSAGKNNNSGGSGGTGSYGASGAQGQPGTVSGKAAQITVMPL
jgi:uncharacterized membrane protein YgcG